MFDDRALALEDRLIEIRKEEQDKAKAKLALMIKGGQLDGINRAIQRFEKALDIPVIQAIWHDCKHDISIDPNMRIPPKFAVYLSKTLAQYSDKLELCDDAIKCGAIGAFSLEEIASITQCTINQVNEAILKHMQGKIMQQPKENLIPSELVPYFKRPQEEFFTMSRTAIVRELQKNGIFEFFSQTTVARLLQVSERTVRYGLENPQVPPKGDELSPLALELKNDPDFQRHKFVTRNSLLSAIYRHPRYTLLRTSEIAKIVNCPLSNASNIKAKVLDQKIQKEEEVIQKEQEQPKPKQAEPIVETIIEPKQAEPIVETIIEPKQAETKQAEQKQADPIVETIIEPKKIGQGKKIVYKQKIDDLLLILYPDGISREQISNLSKVMKHLNRAIRSKG
jgi:hypothetical protein